MYKIIYFNGQIMEILTPINKRFIDIFEVFIDDK